MISDTLRIIICLVAYHMNEKEIITVSAIEILVAKHNPTTRRLNIPTINVTNVSTYLILLIRFHELLRHPFNTFSSFYLLQLLFVLSTTAKLTAAEQTAA